MGSIRSDLVSVNDMNMYVISITRRKKKDKSVIIFDFYCLCKKKAWFRNSNFGYSCSSFVNICYDQLFD